MTLIEKRKQQALGETCGLTARVNPEVSMTLEKKRKQKGNLLISYTVIGCSAGFNDSFKEEKTDRQSYTICASTATNSIQ